ncbi:hypothetical protein [Streptomyces sp. NPDC001492]
MWRISAAAQWWWSRRPGTRTGRPRCTCPAHRLAGREADTAIFGHGDPVVHGATTAPHEAAAATM